MVAQQSVNPGSYLPFAGLVIAAVLPGHRWNHADCSSTSGSEEGAKLTVQDQALILLRSAGFVRSDLRYISARSIAERINPAPITVRSVSASPSSTTPASAAKTGSQRYVSATFSSEGIANLFSGPRVRPEGRMSGVHLKGVVAPQVMGIGREC